MRDIENEQLLPLVNARNLNMMVAKKEYLETLSVDDLARWVRDSEWIIELFDMTPNTAHLSESWPGLRDGNAQD